MLSTVVDVIDNIPYLHANHRFQFCLCSRSRRSLPLRQLAKML